MQNYSLLYNYSCFIFSLIFSFISFCTFLFELFEIKIAYIQVFKKNV